MRGRSRDGCVMRKGQMTTGCARGEGRCKGGGRVTRTGRQQAGSKCTLTAWPGQGRNHRGRCSLQRLVSVDGKRTAALTDCCPSGSTYPIALVFE